MNRLKNKVEKRLNEDNFVVKIGSNVPIGMFSFLYTLKDKSGKYIENSALQRAEIYKSTVEVTKVTKNSAVVFANSKVHNSLVSSFSKLHLVGSVTEVR
jgi:hypothetical protein